MTAVSLREGVLPIVLDGDLSDPAWAQATPISSFLQRDPLEGAPATLSTEARVAFDATAIYVGGASLRSRAGRIVGFLTRRDVESSSDWVHVLIDSYHDRRTAYQFGVNPVGVKQDSYWFNDSSQGRQLGRRLGCRGEARRGGLVRRVPHSVFAAPVQWRRRRAARLRRDAQCRSPERDDDVAAAVEERERLRVVVRRSDGRLDRQRIEATGAGAVRGGRDWTRRRRRSGKSTAEQSRTTTCRWVST